jgi:hypothetical protein
MRTTDRFDCNGQEVFEGSRVIKWWGSFRYKGEMKDFLRVHTITVREKPTHGEKGHYGIVFCLGRSWNLWRGPDVKILTPSDTAILASIPEDTDFFFDEENQPIVLTGKIRSGLTNEQWNKIEEEEKERTRKIMYNILNPPHEQEPRNS